MKRLRFYLLAAMVVIVIGAGGAWAWLNEALHQAGPMTEARAIIVKHGSTAQIAADLHADGLIAHPLLFRIAARLTRAAGPLHAAEFAFPAHATIEQILAILRTAAPVEHHITIAEGLTVRQIKAVLEHAEAATGEVGPIEEGSVLPQTYDYKFATERNLIVARAKAAMDKDLADAWTDRAPNLPLNSARDVLILASIVERETAKPAERPHVAAVYLNRLRQGMKLQADPTVVYLASDGSGVLDHPLTRAELRRDDPFNTYRSTGLPPAPICSPSLASLQAVVHPAESDDLFFVADGTGGHVFSRNLEAHDSAAARWRMLAPSTSHRSSD